MKTTVAAMDFGTSKIVALVAETSGRQRCDITGAGIATYDGYLDGQWNAPDALNEAIANAVHEAEEQSHTRIREIERFRSMGITVAGCFSTPTGQAMLFVPDEERDRTAVLVDMGYLTTEVMAVEGDALTYLQTIPLGGGHIAADLAYGLEITLPAAEQIKRAYVYGLSTGQSTFEGTDKGGNTKNFTREQVEAVLEPRADEICEAVRDAIKDSGVKLGSWSPIYLTGGAMAINRGGRDFLAAKLEKPVRELPRKAVKLSSPAYSSALGLLDLIIDTASSAHNAGWLGAFFRSLFGG